MDEQPKNQNGVQMIRDFRNIQAPNFVSTYANNASVTASFFDVTMVFGEVLGLVDGDVLSVEQKVKVTMALPHAKLLGLLLFQQLAHFEARFGTIIIPPEAVPPAVAEYMRDASIPSVGKDSNESR